MDKAKQVEWLNENVPQEFRFISDKVLPLLPLSYNQLLEWLTDNAYNSPIALALLDQAKREGVFN